MTRQLSPLTPRSHGLRARLLARLAIAVVAAAGAGACGRAPAELPTSAPQAQSAKPLAPKGPLDDQLAAVPEGWDPEAFTLAITPTLKRLSKALEHEAEIDGADFRNALHASFECDPLRPAVFAPAVELGALTSRRGITSHAALAPAEEKSAPVAPADASAPAAPAETAAPREQGIEGLISGLTDLRSLWRAAGPVAVEIKVVGVEPLSDDSATTLLWLQSHGSGPRHFEAHWRCTWSGSRSRDPWLVSIDVLAHEEIERHTPGPFFADWTEAVLGQTPRFDVLLRPGLNRWLAELDRALGSRFFGYHGLSVADVDGDGLDDLYVCLNGGLPNRLFVQSQDGSATDRSQESGLDFLDHTQSALFVDLDGDGDQDAAIGTTELVLLQNDGKARFEPAARFPGSAPVGSLAAADHDLDGDLDLYACSSATDERLLPDPFFDAHNGPPNRMLRNDGEWQFTDVTAASGLDEGNDRFSQSAAWADYDGDGDPDLYVANDFGRDHLFRNDGGTFRDVAREAGVAGLSAGHSADWGDADGDGRPDLYVGNVFAPAGHRLSSLWDPRTAGAYSRHELFERFSQGNTLHANQGDGTFRDVGAAQGVTLGRWAWSSVFAEVDNDGFEDLLVANGFVTNEIEEDL